VSVMECHPSGPFVLTDAPEFDEDQSITPEQVRRISDLMKGSFDYVIIDCAGPLAGCNVPILQNSSLILFTVTFDKPFRNSLKRDLNP